MKKYRVKQVITQIWDVETDETNELCVMDAISDPGRSIVRLISVEDVAEIITPD